TLDPVQALPFLTWPAQPWQQFLVCALLAAGLAVCVYVTRNRLTGSRIAREDDEPEDPDRHLHNQFWIFFGLAPVAISAILAVRAAAGAVRISTALILGLAISAGYLMTMMSIQIRHCHDYPTRWRLKVGGPAALAAVGAIALTLVSSAVIVFVAQRLGDAVPVAVLQPATRFSARASIGYYDELGWIAAAGLGALIVFVLALGTRILALWRFRFARAVPQIRTSIQSMNPDGADDLATRNAKAQMYACLLDDLDWTVTVGVVAFLASTVSVIAGQYLDKSSEQLDRLVGVASWMLVILVLTLVWVVRTAHKDTGIRKALGTLWEVTGFFPRRFHPLGPPSYGERAVPELRKRLVHLTNDGKVLILAHSQGTLLCATTLLGFLSDQAPDRLARMRLVTYGSMLQRSYGRSFPDLVRRTSLFELKARLEDTGLDPNAEEFGVPPTGRPPRWMNFGRTTDFLGGRLFVPPHRPPGCKPEKDRIDDVFFDDPPTVEADTNGGPTPLWLHSFDYLHPNEDPRFAAHVLATLDEMSADGGSHDSALGTP
ncbi:MAG: hypothetical protein M3198_02815, partial [Actinomycetota bacterium]|nr:hypothetical protein [Actinomycetota bacterium]